MGEPLWMAAQRLSPPRKGGVLDLAQHSPHHHDVDPGSPKHISILSNKRGSPQLAPGSLGGVEPQSPAPRPTRTLDATAAPFKIKPGALRLPEAEAMPPPALAMSAAVPVPGTGPAPGSVPAPRGPSRRDRDGGRRREDRRPKGDVDERSEMSSEGNQRHSHRHQHHNHNHNHNHNHPHQHQHQHHQHHQHPLLQQQQHQHQHQQSHQQPYPRGGPDSTSRSSRQRRADEREGDHHRSGGRLDNDSARPTQGGKLFDPRRDDPVKFAAMKKLSSNQGLSTASASNSVISASDSRSHTSTEPTAQSSSAASSEGRRRRRGPGSRANTNDSGDKGRSGGGKGQGKSATAAATASDTNAYVLDLKRSYGEIKKLEQKLQEEHRQASDKLKVGGGSSGGGASGSGSGGGGDLKGEAVSTLPSSSSKRQLVGILGSASAPGFTSKGELDHTYWLQLAAQHRQLAELHAAFMDMALRPGLPSSLHALPEQYNIPIRLWQTGFHLFLERARQSMPSHHEESPESKRTRAELLEHLTDFVYFAYSYYTHLLENEKYKTFKSQWVESLGDLARSRMAVAGLQAKLNAEVGLGSPTPTQEKRLSSSLLLPPATTDKENDGTKSPVGDDAADDASAGVVEGKAKGPTKAAQQQRASIGKAALDDWDLEERETWRTTARDWYARGLAELPGTGRLHHHLGVLSRPDDLRVLHHFCKAMTSSNPYSGARESMLPLFERESQAKRVQPDAGLIDLFVHLHGMLFTKIQLDDFEHVFLRFKERLESTTSPWSDDDIGQATWMMMATINISALLNYSSSSSHLSPPLHDSRGKGFQEREGKSASTKGEKRKEREAARLGDDDNNDGDKRDKEETEAEGGHKGKDEDEDDEEEDDDDDDEPERDDGEDEVGAEETFVEEFVEPPVTLQYAIRLTFDIFSTLIRTALDEFRAASSSPASWHLNPYVTMVLTFFCHEAKQSTTLRSIEEYVPWTDIIALGNSMPTGRTIDPRKDVATKIRGDAVPLPEDWCLRGMAWVSRRVYEHGFWKSRSDRNGLGLVFESEVDVLQRMTEATIDDVFDVEAATDDDEDGDSQGLTDDQGRREPSTLGALGREIKARPNLLDLRWKRVAYAITILAKTIPGLDYDADANEGTGALVLSSPLADKVEAWSLQKEADEARIRVEKLKVMTREDEGDEEEGETSLSEEEDEEEENDDDSDEIKELKRRRRELRRLLRDGRSFVVSSPPARKKSSHGKTQKKPKGKRGKLDIVPGYTILLLDTNAMLTATSVLEKLVESGKWTSVVPLAALTELEGLKKRPAPIGERAKAAIEYMERNIKVKSKWLKVQTSRGNYLPDLRFRTEDIDFAYGMHQDDNDDEETRVARSIDEVILGCLAWQESHFVDRLNLMAEQPERERSKVKPTTAKAVLVTLDRNLRLKARFRGLVAIGPSELVDVLVAGKG